MLGLSSHSSHHPAKFVDLVTCESKNKIFDLLRDHIIEVSRDFVAGVPSFQVNTLLSSGFICLMKVEI